MHDALSFKKLVEGIREAHRALSAQAGRAVNISLTLRNWLIGYYIQEYEQQGQDRAEYGEALLNNLASELTALGIPRCDERELRRYRRFYAVYPQIREAVPPEFRSRIGLPDSGVSASRIGSNSAVEPIIKGTVLASQLSFSHLAELIAIGDDSKRTFYEVECIKGNWSLRELKRQVGSLYFERADLSLDKQKLSEMVRRQADSCPAFDIRDPYVFEFLGLTSAEVMSESHLEAQLINKLQAFLLELGHGFCFEARQKRILIGGIHFFVDLVFYHRILKCHVLVELKLERFSHESLGQLNTYVSWYRRNMMSDGDNPPIGILLCTDKNNALAEYALAGMDSQLFVSKYQLALPKREDMQRFIDQQVRQATE